MAFGQRTKFVRAEHLAMAKVKNVATVQYFKSNPIFELIAYVLYEHPYLKLFQEGQYSSCNMLQHYIDWFTCNNHQKTCFKTYYSKNSKIKYLTTTKKSSRIYSDVNIS